MSEHPLPAQDERRQRAVAELAVGQPGLASCATRSSWLR
jgi:hypothetical protein